MKEISDISIQRMNNGAHFTFVSNILARAEADTAVKEKASELVSNFKAAVTAEDEALKISQKSLLTDDITKADSDRDALYAGYKKAVEAFLAMPIADMAQAAKVLAQHIKDYKINTAYRLKNLKRPIPADIPSAVVITDDIPGGNHPKTFPHTPKKLLFSSN